jgi:hypothetical protein
MVMLGVETFGETRQIFNRDIVSIWTETDISGVSGLDYLDYTAPSAQVMKSATTQVLELYGRESSGHWCKARLLMAFLEVAYEQIELDLAPGRRNKVGNSHRFLNPRGQAPTPADGDTV